MRRCVFLVVCLFALALPVFLPPAAWADERITNYDVAGTVGKDASLTVRERITVTAEGKAIKRGIFRVFPLRERTDSGKLRDLNFELLSVQRDGASETFLTKEEDNNIYIYIGSADERLAPGNYTYELTYRVANSLRFFPDHDELYWNVTGNDWDFPIDSASFELVLPEGGAPAGTKVFTGGRGARGGDARLEGKNVFRTTRPFTVGEGLTIVFGWQKGLVDHPAPGLAGFLAANTWLVYALLILSALGYYLTAWFLFGGDPKPGTVIPLFSPPEGMSPGEICCLRDMNFSVKAFQVDLLWIATSGFLRIEFEGD
jgi:hypothetical protein